MSDWTTGLQKPVAPLRRPDASALPVATTSTVERARRYLAKMDPAISGSGGHDATFAAARKMADFELSEDEVFRLLRDDYNPRCEPPWADAELRHKASQAMDRREVRPMPDRPVARHGAPRSASPVNEDGEVLEPPAGRFDDEGDGTLPDGLPNEASAEPSPDVAPARPRSLADIVSEWEQEGPLVRVPTGIAALDRLSNGGLPVPWRVIVVGAPSAGKTAVSVIIADALARAAESAGMCVGILGVDEEPEDLAIRLLQIAGYTLAEAEERVPAVLQEMRRSVEGLRLRLYDDNFTIESAGADLAAWAKQEGRAAALFLDSLHAVRSIAGAEAQNPREAVEANVRAMRGVSTKLRMLVVASAEANRSSYRSDDAAETTNDLAAGAESRAVEFGAQTQLMLRTPKNHPNVIHVRVAKNRRADRGEFWLRLDRGRHAVEECANPMADPALAAYREDAKRSIARTNVLKDAEELAALLYRHPGGLGEQDLRAALRVAGHKWGVERLEAARLALRDGHKGVRLESTRDGKKNVSRVVSEQSDRGDS